MIHLQNCAKNINLESHTLKPNRIYIALEIYKTLLSVVNIDASSLAMIPLSVQLTDKLIKELNK